MIYIHPLRMLVTQAAVEFCCTVRAFEADHQTTATSIEFSFKYYVRTEYLWRHAYSAVSTAWMSSLRGVRSLSYASFKKP
jgi:hypothetical protein